MILVAVFGLKDEEEAAVKAMEQHTKDKLVIIHLKCVHTHTPEQTFLLAAAQPARCRPCTALTYTYAYLFYPANVLSDLLTTRLRSWRLLAVTRSTTGHTTLRGTLRSRPCIVSTAYPAAHG